MQLTLAVLVWLYVLATPPNAWGIFIRLPATLVHELSHYFVALFLGCRPNLPTLWPKRVGSYWVMGSVRFHLKSGASALVALAPLTLLPMGLFMLEGPSMSPAFNLFIWAPLSAMLFVGCLPSLKDWEIAFTDPVGLFLACLICSVTYFGYVLPKVHLLLGISSLPG